MRNIRKWICAFTLLSMGRIVFSVNGNVGRLGTLRDYDRINANEVRQARPAFHVGPLPYSSNAMPLSLAPAKPQIL